LLGEELTLAAPESMPDAMIARFAADLGVFTREAVRVRVVPGPDESAGLNITVDPTVCPEEGYRLEISPRRICLTGGSPTGVAWGFASLAQMIVCRHVERFIPCGRMEDSPSYAYRGLLVDVARLPHSMATLEQLVTLCWYYKIKYMQLHLSDTEAFTFSSARFPKLATPRNHHSLEAWRRLEAYAASRGVVLIPELDVPGHANKRLRELCPNRPFAVVSPVINPVSERTFETLDVLIGEIIDVFPRSPYFHIGADEVNYDAWSRCRDCRDFLAARGLTDIRECYRHFIVRMNELVRRHGRRMVVWEGFAREGAIRIPDDVVVQFFEIDYIQPEEATALGHDVVNSCWGPLYVVPHSGSCATAPLASGDLWQRRGRPGGRFPRLHTRVWRGQGSENPLPGAAAREEMPVREGGSGVGEVVGIHDVLVGAERCRRDSFPASPASGHERPALESFGAEAVSRFPVPAGIA
jgi:hexosaminidase